MVMGKIEVCTDIHYVGFEGEFVAVIVPSNEPLVWLLPLMDIMDLDLAQEEIKLGRGLFKYRYRYVTVYKAHINLYDTLGCMPLNRLQLWLDSVKSTTDKIRRVKTVCYDHIVTELEKAD